MTPASFIIAAISAVLTVLTLFGVARADPMLNDFAYPYTVERHTVVSQGQAVQMAYMDVTPEEENGRTVVLLHGKNFCAATWEGTMNALLGAGYRVIAPDQAGFCKSTKPEGYQYGLHTLAANTKSLLEAAGIDRPIMMGHSMGGMLAMRYAVQYPQAISGLVLVNPIGLEDWRAMGVPNATVDELIAGQQQTTRQSIKDYQQSTYYVGEWKPRYDIWVDMLWSMYDGEGRAVTERHQALTADMIFNQPVVHDLPRITAPTLLIIGEQDNTALGKARAPEAIRQQLGDYSALAEATRDAIPDARLVSYPALGHSPHIQAPERFYDDLLGGLADL